MARFIFGLFEVAAVAYSTTDPTRSLIPMVIHGEKKTKENESLLVKSFASGWMSQYFQSDNFWHFLDKPQLDNPGMRTLELYVPISDSHE